MPSVSWVESRVRCPAFVPLACHSFQMLTAPARLRRSRKGLTGSVWFEGKNEIDCDLERVKRSFDELGGHYVGVVGLMPGLTSVELVDQGSDFVTIRTNEGLMKRTNITKRAEADRVVVEFDEVYEAGSKVTVTSHFSNEFTADGNGITHQMVIWTCTVLQVLLVR